MRRAYAAAIFAVLLNAGACATAVPLAQFHPGEDLAAERTEWRGDKTGYVWLRRGIQVTVGTATNAASATGVFTFHNVGTRFGSTSPDTDAITFQLPPGATLVNARARTLHLGKHATVLPLKNHKRVADHPMDPDQEIWTLEFPPTPAGGILECITRFEVQGTLSADTRHLGDPMGITSEYLLRYDFPEHAIGAFQVIGVQARPVVTRKNGMEIIALLQRNVPRNGVDRITGTGIGGISGAPTYTRYVTKSASPRGYVQRFANTWSVATWPYMKKMVNPSEDFREGLPAPFKVAGKDRDAINSLFLWVRDRIQVKDALDSPWDSGRSLPEVVRDNLLTATDKVHLLHWLLDAAEIPHSLAMARSYPLPALDPGLPTPNAFDTPVIHITSEDLWLDPACQTCQAGELRNGLRGQQAITLPAANAFPRQLPTE